MSGLMFTLVGDGDDANIVVFIPGAEPLVAHSSHPNFNAIVTAARAGDEAVAELFDIAEAVISRFDRLSTRVTTANGQLFLDGEVIAGAVVDHILSSMKSGLQDWEPLVKFIENLAANPNQGSVDQLYAWLSRESFTIDTDGMIVGYKGVQPDGKGGYESVNRGRAIVNDVVHSGAIPNNPGDVVEMPRSEVTFDSAVGCSTGLHVGNYAYANEWARGALLEVRVNPRDVVSVPTDCEAQKMRVCRYTVVDLFEQEKYDEPVIGAIYYGPQEDLLDEDFDLWGDWEAVEDEEYIDLY